MNSWKGAGRSTKGVPMTLWENKGAMNKSLRIANTRLALEGGPDPSNIAVSWLDHWLTVVNNGAIALTITSEGRSAFKVFWIEALMVVTVAKDGLRVRDIEVSNVEPKICWKASTKSSNSYFSLLYDEDSNQTYLRCYNRHSRCETTSHSF